MTKERKLNKISLKLFIVMGLWFSVILLDFEFSWQQPLQQPGYYILDLKLSTRDTEILSFV